MRPECFWLLVLFSLFTASTRTVESRYIAGKIQQRNDTDEEEVDLEDVLMDYYDSLAELWRKGSNYGPGKENGSPAEEREEENGMKLKRQNEKDEIVRRQHHQERAPGDAGGLPPTGAKSYFDLTVPMQIGNYTYHFLNESYASILDMERANRERETMEANTTRIKNLRLNSIKDSVLSLRGGNSSFLGDFPRAKQTKTLTEIFERQLKDAPFWSASSIYTEKYQSFYPSCDLPKNTDEAPWSDPFSMNLFFDVSFAPPKQDSTLMIVNAVLRLYTISQTNFTFSAGNISVPGLKVHLDRSPVNIPNLSLLNADDEKQVRLSVYWHTKPLRRQRAKKKLLDSRMVSLNGSHNLTFGIRAAVRSWKESGRNFGLAVTVEDEDGTLLDPSDFIHQMNCSKWAATVKPLPLFGFDSPAQYFIEDPSRFEGGNGTVNETNYDDESSSFSAVPIRYPILNVRTREVPLSELRNLALLRSTKLELEARFRSAARHGQRPAVSEEELHTRRPIDARITDFENVPIGSPIAQERRSHPESGSPGEDAAALETPDDGGGGAGR